MSSQPTAEWDVDSVRADFPILSTRIRGKHPLVYLDNAATTQHPRAVIQALVDVYEKHYANVHRGVHWLSDHTTDLFERARDEVRQFIGAEHSHEVIFTSGTTAAINLVAHSWADRFVSPGDEILLTEMEHHANLVPWQQLAARKGCLLRHIPITDDGQLDLSQLDTLLNSRTRMLAVTAMSNVLGTCNPISQLTQAARQVGAHVLVDAAQSVPHQVTDIRQWDADFVAFSGHKMLGPTGVGVLYGRASLLDAMPPFLGGGSMIRRVRLEEFEPADLPSKFEAGTPPIAPAIGLSAAIRYLHQIGMDRIHAHELSLVNLAHRKLLEIPGIQILGPAIEHKGGIVSFTVDGVHPHDVAQLLDQDGIAIRAGHHCAMPLHKRLKVNASNRASFYFYNTAAEVEKLAESLRRVKATFRRN